MSAAIGGDIERNNAQLGVGQDKAYAPTFEGVNNGQTVKTEAPSAMGGSYDVYWQWDANSKKWNSIDKATYDDNRLKLKAATSIGDQGGPDLAAAEESSSLRYPNKDIGNDSHYVLFQFYEYNPPFGGRSREETAANLTPEIGPPAPDYGYGATKGYDYNQANQYESAGDDYKSILMYMPEDISTGFKANWGGKAVSNIGADALRAAGAEGFKKIGEGIDAIADASQRALALTGSAALRKSIQAITGDVLSNNDIFGGISGAILNPNTELLFDSVDMRNFTLNFKMVPRYADEADVINEICKIFKACTLPSKDPGEVFAQRNDGITAGFIGVPKLCKVHFMVGSNENTYLPKFKMCAITEVSVNYTPDGAYATYNNDAPVATVLSVSFQETKLVFADEILNDTIR